MKKALVVFSVMVAGFVQAALYTNDFASGIGTFDSDASVSIGPGFVLSKAGGDMTPTVRKLNGKVQFQNLAGSGTVGAANVVLRYEGLALKNTNLGESFTIKGDFRTHNAEASSLLYGMAFNYQADGSYYAARIDTGDTDVLQFVRFNSSGTVSAFANISNSQKLALGSDYTFEISSSAPGVFNYKLTGANLDGGQLSGTATDTVLKLKDGYAGFYISSLNTAPLADNLYINVIPEPTTLGLFSISFLGVLLVRKMGYFL